MVWRHSRGRYYRSCEGRVAHRLPGGNARAFLDFRRRFDSSPEAEGSNGALECLHRELPFTFSQALYWVGVGMRRTLPGFILLAGEVDVLGKQKEEACVDGICCPLTVAAYVASSQQSL